MLGTGAALPGEASTALTRPNVHVVPSLAGFDGTTAIASDGTRHDVDAVVLATGFHTTVLPVADRITGAHGRTLADVWRGSPRAHRGTTVSGFPNLFLVNGPNTGVGHTSVLLHLETQIAYVVNVLTTLRANGLTVFDSKQHVQDRWNDEVQRRLQRTVWQRGGCTSDSYMDSTGRNTTLWPGTTGSFGRSLRRFDIVEHDTA